mgnify:CR=1 FL=1
MNYALYRNIPKAVRIVKEENPEVLMKCVKNAAEIENIRRGHIKDGVAHTKFMYWLKKHAGKETITELSASEKLENFRKERKDISGRALIRSVPMDSMRRSCIILLHRRRMWN